MRKLGSKGRLYSRRISGAGVEGLVVQENTLLLLSQTRRRWKNTRNPRPPRRVPET